jgi:hypothetical protein
VGLVISTTWNVGGTQIITGLNGKGFEITHGVVYQDIEAEKKRELREKAEAYDQL